MRPSGCSERDLDPASGRARRRAAHASRESHCAPQGCSKAPSVSLQRAVEARTHRPGIGASNCAREWKAPTSAFTLLSEPRRTSGRHGDAIPCSRRPGTTVARSSIASRRLGRGWSRGHHRGGTTAAERALGHYRRTTWPTATPCREIATPSTSVPRRSLKQSTAAGLTRETRSRSRTGERMSSVPRRLGRTHGRFDQGASLVAAARARHRRAGSAGVCGDVQCGDCSARSSCSPATRLRQRSTLSLSSATELDATQAYSHLASRAGDLAETLLRPRPTDEASEWAEVAERHRRPTMSMRCLVDAGSSEDPRARAGSSSKAWRSPEAVQLAETTDALNPREGDSGISVRFLLAGRAERRGGCVTVQALELYERRGTSVGAAHARAAEWRRARLGDSKARLEAGLAFAIRTCASQFRGRRRSPKRRAEPRARADRLRARPACGAVK